MINLPLVHNVIYPIKNHKFYSGKNKQVISSLLFEASNGYCMYCGKKLKFDSKHESNIEHSVDKTMVVEGFNYLEHCKYNMAITCQSCNQKYKKIMIENVEIKVNFAFKSCPKECTSPCNFIIKATREYIYKNQIALQPRGLEIENATINYCLMRQIFIPTVNYSDSVYNHKNVQEVLSNHIARFHLNSSMYTESIVNFCEKIVGLSKIVSESADIRDIENFIDVLDKENIIVYQFANKIVENSRTFNELLEWAKYILVVSYL